MSTTVFQTYYLYAFLCPRLPAPWQRQEMHALHLLTVKYCFGWIKQSSVNNISSSSVHSTTTKALFLFQMQHDQKVAVTLKTIFEAVTVSCTVLNKCIKRHHIRDKVLSYVQCNIAKCIKLLTALSQVFILHQKYDTTPGEWISTSTTVRVRHDI